MPRKNAKKSVKPSKSASASKSDLIRQMAANNPGVGPTEIANKIMTAHAVKVSPAMVSTVLSQDRSRGGKPARRGRPVRTLDTAEPLAIEDAKDALQKTTERFRSQQELADRHMAKTFDFGRLYGMNLDGEARMLALASRVCAHRRERALTLLMHAMSEVGGMTELTKLFEGVQELIQPKMPVKESQTA